LFSLVDIYRDNQSIPVLSLAPCRSCRNIKQGIGSALVREGLRKCQDTGYPIVVVLGHPGFYPRFGFTPAGEKGLQLPFDALRSFMVYELSAHALDGIRGLVAYPLNLAKNRDYFYTHRWAA